MEEINQDPDIKVTSVLADMPERHTLRGLIAISGRYSCEYCVGRARTGGGISWPYPEFYKCDLRNHQDMEGIARYSVEIPRLAFFK